MGIAIGGSRFSDFHFLLEICISHSDEVGIVVGDQRSSHQSRRYYKVPVLVRGEWQDILLGHVRRNLERTSAITTTCRMTLTSSMAQPATRRVSTVAAAPTA